LAVARCWCIVGGMSIEIVETQAEDNRKRTLIDALYRKYSQALRKFLVRRHVNQEDVADIVQETYYRVLNSGDVEMIHHPKAFLFQVANNVARNAAKHRRSGVEGDAADIDDIEVNDQSPSPYRWLKAEQQLGVVRAALEELAPKCREVFVLNRFENLTYADIAAELDLSVSMIEKYVSQALTHLRTRVAEADVGRSNLYLSKSRR
jgi:RNA polymerase sigma factor (sigma-70 family)